MKRCRRSQIEDLTHGPEDPMCAYLPEEVVAEIVVRLQIKALFRFNCVSKHWKSIISSQKFVQKYLKRSNHSPQRLLALVPPNTDSLYRHYWRKDLKELSEHDPDLVDERLSIKNVFFVSPSDDNHHCLVATSKGLVLSEVRPPEEKGSEITLCVSNPLTKQFAYLPQPPLPIGDCVTGFVATRSGTGSPLLTYKVVLIRRVNIIGLPFECVETSAHIFSSDTGGWASWEVSKCPVEVFNWNVKPCFPHKGVLHWVSRDSGTLITYDPYNIPHRFGFILLPIHHPKHLANRPHWVHVHVVCSGDQELLKLCQISSLDRNAKFRAWELSGEEGEWSVIDDSLCRVLQPHFTMLQAGPKQPVRSHSGSLPSPFDTRFTMLQVAPNPELICARGLFNYPLIPIQLFPWSSPVYNASF